MLVGPRATVERFAHEARRLLPRTAILRASQPVYAVDRAALRGSHASAEVRRASVADVPQLALASAQMIASEIGSAPDPRGAEFLARTTRIAEAGWWWRGYADGACVFQCNVGSATAATAQIQGVWTPPAFRGRGHAARALGAIAERLLSEFPTLCLYVNDFNAPAIALYERVGFTRAGEYRTLLF